MPSKSGTASVFNRPICADSPDSIFRYPRPSHDARDLTAPLTSRTREAFEITVAGLGFE